MRRLFCALLCLCFLVIPASAQEPAKYVALTFDDGPSGRFTRTLLDGLLERDVKATFFLCGYRIRQYPAETERILAEGHEIGCHGYSHKKMQDMNRRDIAAEISDTIDLLPEGCRVRFFRPPGGCCSENIRQVAEARQMPILSWSIDPKDWASHDAASIEKFVLKQAKDGDVILLHDMTESSVTAALDIVDALLDQGFRFATVSELAALRGFSLRPGKSYSAFPRKQP